MIFVLERFHWSRMVLFSIQTEGGPQVSLLNYLEGVGGMNYSEYIVVWPARVSLLGNAL